MNSLINVEDFIEDPITMLKRHCSMFLYGSNGIPEILTNRIAQDFFSFALLHLTCTMFLTSDSNNDVGIFHRILDPIGKSELLVRIDDIFESAIGNTTVGEFIRLRRNRLATHRSLSIKELPQENLEVSFDPDSIKQYYQAMDSLSREVSYLYDKLDQLKN
jgi:hypothetical protein